MRNKLIKFLFFVLATFLLPGCSFHQLYQKKNVVKSPYEQVDYQALVKRYMKKDKSDIMEGIYLVSGSVTKKSTGFMNSAEKEKIKDRRENYAQVAILRDPGETGRDYIELSLDREFLPSYSIVGEFVTTTSGNLLVYKHLEPKNKNTTFTFTIDEQGDILEGVRVENDGNSTITYHLSYVKIYPK